MELDELVGCLWCCISCVQWHEIMCWGAMAVPNLAKNLKKMADLPVKAVCTWDKVAVVYWGLKIAIRFKWLIVLSCQAARIRRNEEIWSNEESVVHRLPEHYKKRWREGRRERLDDGLSLNTRTVWVKKSSLHSSNSHGSERRVCVWNEGTDYSLWKPC